MLRVSDNRRFLVHDDGSPFFYLADTAWELLHRLDRDDTTLYLDDRAAKGFTAIQTVALAEVDGLTLPTPAGELPLHDRDPARPNDAYFDHVEWVIDEAAARGLFVALLPTWGRYVVSAGWEGLQAADHVVFSETNAERFGRYVGDRFADKANLIWVIGGDRDPTGVVSVFRAMAQGIKAAGAKQLMTFHPPGGGGGSADWLHGEDWLDFHARQSGHSRRYTPNWRYLDRDYALEPVRPCIDMEPCYENHPVDFRSHSLWFDDHDVRCAAYWAVFHGAFGHTYGCHDIWMMRKPGDPPGGTARGWWFESLHLPGARQMGYLKRLMLSRPFLTRRPAPELVLQRDRVESDHAAATRDGGAGADATDASYVMAYSPLAGPIALDTRVLGQGRLRVWDVNPRTGRAVVLDEPENAGRYVAPALQTGPDRVVLIDRVDAGFVAPR